MAIALKGDFIGFSFNGYRSEELGIVRVSDGSRYDEDLLPTSQDKTVQVPGGDGFYYFGSDYTQKPFNINIAFDELTEAQFRKLQQVFGTKELGKLIFDERPYKYYMVKSGNPQLKYICFGKEGEPRIYKGEGTLTFTAYYPFAKSKYKFLEDYGDIYYPNKNEWAVASGLKASKTTTDFTYDTFNTNNICRVYNAGDLDADFILRFEGGITSTSGCQIDLRKAGDTVTHFAYLKLGKFDLYNGDNGFQINTKKNLIEGVKKSGTGDNAPLNILTGTLYNKYIVEGDFFKIPHNDDNLEIGVSSGTPINLFYDYIYY